MASEGRVATMSPRQLTWALICVALFGLALRLWAAGSTPIGYDEYWHVFIARNLPREFRSLAHPPLFILLLRACDAALHSPWSYRAVSLLSGTALVFLFGHVLRKLGASAPVVLLGALGAAVARNLVLLSVVVEAYMLCCAFVLFAFVFYLDLLAPQPRRRSRLGFALFASLALLSHYAAAFFLAVAAAAPLLALALLPGWRASMAHSWRRRWKADIATLAPPLVIGAGLYVFLARSWVRALNHLPGFYFEAARESAAAFLARNAAATSALLLPGAPGSRALLGLLLVLFVALVLITAAAAKGDDVTRALRLMPAAFLLLLLVLGGVGGLLGKYPFGGMMRHQMLLYLFAPLAAWVALDQLRAQARAVVVRGASVALGFAAVAGTGLLTAQEIARTPGASWAGADTFEREFGSEPALQVDQYNLIGFFMHAHDWDWMYLGPLGSSGVEAYRLTRDGRSRTLFAHRGRWNMDLADPGLYRDLAASSRLGGQPCAVLFSARQVPLDPEPSQAGLQELASGARLELSRARLSRAVVLARLCAGEVVASTPPGVHRIVPPAIAAGVPFQVQPDGSSALSVEGENFRPGAVVVLAGRPLPTVFGNPGWVTATVPRALTAQPGRLELRVVDPERGASAAVIFEVIP